MQALRYTQKVPPGRELTIVAPEHIRTNQTIEVIILVEDQTSSYDEKVNQMGAAMADPLFVQDLQEIAADFSTTDLQDWEPAANHTDEYMALEYFCRRFEPGSRF